MLSERLSPPRPDFIAECLHKLKSGGMMVPKGIAAADFISEYTIALGGVPQYGLMMVVAKLKRGEYLDIKPDFVPLPAQIAAMARAECREIRDDIARLREKKNTIADAVKPAVETKEERERQLARIRELHAGFKRETTAVKESAAGVVHEPMDADKAAYWATMQSLPDAQTVNADQRAFRRKIADEVASVAPTQRISEDEMQAILRADMFEPEVEQPETKQQEVADVEF